MARKSSGFDDTDSVNVTTVHGGSGTEKKVTVYDPELVLGKPVADPAAVPTFPLVAGSACPSFTAGTYVIWSYMWSDAYVNATNLSLEVQLYFTSATTGTATLSAELDAKKDGADPESASYDTANIQTVAAPGTVRNATRATIALTNQDSAADGETVYVRFGVSTWTGGGNVVVIGHRIRSA